MFMVMTEGKHKITLEEWIHLFQPKEIGHQLMGLYTFPIKVGSEKIVQGLLDGLRSAWKIRFF